MTIAAETSLAEEQQHADSSVRTDPVDLELWTYRLEAIAQMRAEGVDVTRWAGDGTLRTRDNITGHDVVREGGSPMQDYREVTEPLFGFRRAVRRGRLRGVWIDGIRGASSFEGVMDGMTVDLWADGLPFRVETDGTTWKFAYRERMAFMESQPSYPEIGGSAERYRSLSLVSMEAEMGVQLPRTIAGHTRETQFDRTSGRSPRTSYVVWRSRGGTEIQFLSSAPVAAQSDGSGITRTRGMVCYHRQSEVEFVEFYAPDVTTLRQAVAAVRVDLVVDLEAALKREQHED